MSLKEQLSPATANRPFSAFPAQLSLPNLSSSLAVPEETPRNPRLSFIVLKYCIFICGYDGYLIAFVRTIIISVLLLLIILHNYKHIIITVCSVYLGRVIGSQSTSKFLSDGPTTIHNLLLLLFNYYSKMFP